VDEQVVLGQEAGKEHAVPELIGAFGNQPVDLLWPFSGPGRLTAWHGTEMNAERAAGLGKTGRNGFGIGSLDIEPLERGTGAILGLVAGSDDGLFQSVP